MMSLLPNVPSVSMVVAERGSEWSGWFAALKKACAEVILVQQERGESPSAFAQRVRTRVSELDQLGQTLREAVIVGGGRTDKDAIAARSLEIRALVSPMVRAGAGRVFLGSGGRDKYSMHALASLVGEMLRGTGVLVAPSNEAPALAA